jgi:RNA polymerase sigma-70 factor (ECF subfamily)
MESIPLSDESAAVLLAQEGHPQAFRALYDRHFEAVYRTAFRYTRTPQDAEDVLQETFVKAFKNIGRFDFERGVPFAVWIGRICVNSALSQLRRSRARKDPATFSLTASLYDPPAAGLSPEEAALLGQMAVRIQETLHRLPPRQELIFRLRYIEGRNMNEITSELGCSPNTVKSHLRRALVAVRRRLRPLWSEP